MPTAAGSRRSPTRRQPVSPPQPGRPFRAAARTCGCSSMGSPMRSRRDLSCRLQSGMVRLLAGSRGGHDGSCVQLALGGAFIAVPPHFLSGAYRADQARASSSGAHLAWFLDEVKSLRDEAKRQNPRRRVVLLAHSMGNFALAAGVQAWFLSRDTTAIFDYAVLAAADEIDKSFELPAGARLSRLPDLAAGISVYYSLRDVAMYLSQAINLTERLGFDGPAHKFNTALYPPNRFRSINCTDLNDYNSTVPPDASHQYYRRSPKARDDIARAFTGQPVAPGNRTSFKLVPRSRGSQRSERHIRRRADRRQRGGPSPLRSRALPPQVGPRSARRCAQSRGETLRRDPRRR